jgi:tRNA-dihydrouridine synthase A
MNINRTIAIAPMMACTDRHYRMLMRVITKNTLLYTEMLTAGAIIHGDREYLLGYSPEEHPLALQVGGSKPAELAKAAKITEDFGYDEINLNVGCPSDRVQAGRFGACLMKEPKLVAECVAAMQAEVNIPVTVKTRLGVDELDSYQHLCKFVNTVANVGCKTFIIHARKAWLKGLSPRENREVPPLCYERVYQLKQDFPELEIIINGGINNLAAIKQHLQHVDGVMLGRAAYANPFLFATVDQIFFNAVNQINSPHEVVWRYLPYIAKSLTAGVPLKCLIKHLLPLFQGMPGAKAWRRYLSSHQQINNIEVVEKALKFLVC